MVEVVVVNAPRGDLEQGKFRLDADGNATIAVSSIGNFVSGVVFDAITVTYPDTVTEVYSYRSGGVSGSVVATITVIYTTATKDVLLSVART